MLAALGDAAPPVLHTLHWDLRRNADFYASFDGRGRVFFAGVSDSQIAAGAGRLCAGRPSARCRWPCPSRRAGPRLRRSGPTRCSCCPGCASSRASTSRCGPAGRPGCRWCSPDRSVGSPTAPALDAALADPASPVRGYPDVRWFLEHVAPQLDGERARWVGSVSGSGEGRPAPAVAGRAVPDPLGGARRHRGLRGAGRRHAGRGDGPGLPALARRARRHRLPRRRRGGASPRRWGGWTSWTPQACADAARRRFCPEVMADGYERLYAEVLRRAGARPGHRPRQVAATPAR